MAEWSACVKVYYKNAPEGVMMIKYGIYLELIAEIL
jgi:hypothetical protein